MASQNINLVKKLQNRPKNLKKCENKNAYWNINPRSIFGFRTKQIKKKIVFTQLKKKETT